MDPYDDAVYGSGVSTIGDPAWETTRSSMGYALTFAKRMNLLAMRPHGELASTGFCLANPTSQNGEYLVYVPQAGTSTVDLSATPGTLVVEWFRPSDGQSSAGGTVTGGAVRSFSSAFLGSDAVLYLHR